MSVEDRPQVVLVNRCIIKDDDQRILIVQRSQTDSFNPSKWELPGGKLDHGQDLTHAMKREVEEETGLEVEAVSPMVYSESFIIRDGGKYDGLPYVLLVSIGRIIRGEVTLSSEHEDNAWVPYETALEYDLTEECDKALRTVGKFTIDNS